MPRAINMSLHCYSGVGSLSARLLEPREGDAVRAFALFMSVAALFMRSRHLTVVMGRFASGLGCPLSRTPDADPGSPSYHGMATGGVQGIHPHGAMDTPCRVE